MYSCLSVHRHTHNLQSRGSSPSCPCSPRPQAYNTLLLTTILKSQHPDFLVHLLHSLAAERAVENLCLLSV